MSEATATNMVKVYSGHVTVRAGQVEYHDILANFTLDAGEDFPPLPAGTIGRSYIPGERHSVTNGVKATQLPMPWADGDALLPRAAELVAAKVLREDLDIIDPGPVNIRAKRTAALEALLARGALEDDATQEEKDYQTEKDKKKD